MKKTDFLTKTTVAVIALMALSFSAEARSRYDKHHRRTPYSRWHARHHQPKMSIESRVQLELARRGFYRGAIDGRLGPQSRSAIRSYQIRHRLPVSGRIDYPLLRSLRLA